jgi:superfamily II DNA/RNA helicase
VLILSLIPKLIQEITLTPSTNVSFASFEDMPLHAKLAQAVKACGYTTPTEIQKLAIPPVLDGRDLLASAQTGSGKTAAFALPAIQQLLTEPVPTSGRGPRVLVLTPTRELAEQITKTFASLCKFTQLKFGVVTGGVGYFPQEQLLRKPVDILVATPGRLMDHMRSNRIDFSRLSMFILDEADRMLDMGFVQDMELIAKSLPDRHQTLLFSATLEGNVQRISRQFLHNPVCIQLAAATQKHELITQRVHLVDDFYHKCALLTHVLEEPGMWQAIVFTGTKRSADELVEGLTKRGVNCAVLHGDIKQSRRTRTLERMHQGHLRVLVATDVAARGLDIKKLSHVINFDLPRTAEDYVHRIGRTGRCGEKGIAVSLASPKDRAILAQIERFTGQRLKPQVIEGLEPKNSFETPPSSAKPRSRQGQGPSTSRRPARGGQSSHSPYSGQSGQRRQSGEGRPFTGQGRPSESGSRDNVARPAYGKPRFSSAKPTVGSSSNPKGGFSRGKPNAGNAGARSTGHSGHRQEQNQSRGFVKVRERG